MTKSQSQRPSLIAFWRRLIALDTFAPRSVEQRQAQLLGTFILIFFFACLITTFTHGLYHPDSNLFTLPEFYVTGGGCIVLGLAFYFNRTGRYHFAALLTIGVLMALIFFMAIPDHQPGVITFLYYLILPVLLSSTFLSERVTIILVAISMSGMVVLPVLCPQVKWDDVPGFFLLISAILVLLLQRHRGQLEMIRQQELLKSEERYRAVAQGGLDIFFLLQPERDSSGQIVNFRFMDVNVRAEAYFGMPRDQLIGEKFCTVFPAVKECGLFDRYAAVMNSGEPYAGDFSLPNSQGKSGHYMQQIVPYTDGLAVTIHDLTSQKNAESQRLQLAVERERGNVLRAFVDEAVSHDLRTPLSTIKTSLYLLGRVDDPEKQERYLHNLNGQVDNLTNIVENLLAMSQLHKPKLELEQKRIDLNKLIREVLMSQQIFATHKGHRMEFDPGVETLPVLGDETLLEQAIEQLLKNAINFTPDKGHIVIETMQKETQALIRVRDSGIGIAPEDLPYIFEPFFRADKARQVNIGEMGLGLPIVKQIVTAHSGKVTVESQLNEGSVFTVWLPLLVESGKAPEDGAKAG